MLKAGLTGGMGSGKSAAGEIFRSLGCPTLDLDLVSRQVTRPGQPALDAISDVFGPGILQADGTLNRSKLAEVAFTDIESRICLEQILHPLIMEAAGEWIQAMEGRPDPPPVVMLEIPLLFEVGLEHTVDRIVLITASVETRVQRIVVRRGISETEARARMASQQSDDSKRSRSHYIIDNNGSLENLRQSVGEVWKKLAAEAG